MFKRIKKFFKDLINPPTDLATKLGFKQEIDIVVRRPDGSIKAERHIRK